MNNKSPIHRAPAGVKLLGLLIITSFVFVGTKGLSYYLGEIISFVILIVFACIAKIRTVNLFTGVKPLLYMLLFVLLFRSFDVFPLRFVFGGFKAGLIFDIQILISFACCCLFFSTTSMLELRAGLLILERLLVSPLDVLLSFFKTAWAQEARAFLHYGFLSLGIALMLGFIKKFFALWETSNQAWTARGGKNGLSRIVVLIPLVTERMIYKAAETADALEARGLGLEDAERRK
ncbi:CbiQ family ECF transporter T component [Breznakiellaceae bacterium SP9]